jgi:hypothetical protein
MQKIMYKKKWCKFGDKCKYNKCEFMCKFAHYPEEKKKLKFNKPINKNHYDVYTSSDILLKKSVEICNNVGVYQLLLKNKMGFGINKIIQSYLNIQKMLECKETIDECKWCCKIFSYLYDNDEIKYRRISLIHRNNPFTCATLRQTCNIGPLCLDCALYKIPIRCDICEKYTNANNMEFNYDLRKDDELMVLFTGCQYGHANLEKIYKHAQNICTHCVIGYHQNVMLPEFCYCNVCYGNYRDILSFRFGSKIANNYT